MKKIGILGCMCVMVLQLLTACGTDSDIYLETHVTETVEEAVQRELEVKEEESMCYVYICGAVQSPGVYVLAQGSRLYEVIDLAGGLLEEADAASMNQAELVTDGQMIRICTKQEMLQMQETPVISEVSDDGRVNINTADKATLMTLPGIGESKAEAILSYREEKGVFSSIEDLKEIAGIKDGIFTQIKEHIKVSN